MFIVAEWEPDGSSALLLWRGEKFVGTICQTKPKRWQLNDADGAVLGVFKSQRQAVAHAAKIAYGAAQ